MKKHLRFAVAVLLASVFLQNAFAQKQEQMTILDSLVTAEHYTEAAELARTLGEAGEKAYVHAMQLQIKQKDLSSLEPLLLELTAFLKPGYAANPQNGYLEALTKLAYSYHERNLYEKSTDIWLELTREIEKRDGAGSLSFANASYSWAMTKYGMNDYIGCEQTLSQVTNIARKVEGDQSNLFLKAESFRISMMVKLKQLDKARAHLDSLPTDFFTASKEARQQVFNAKANLYRALGQPLEALACLDSIDYLYRNNETRSLKTQYIFQVRRKNLMLQLKRFDDAKSLLKKIVVLHRLRFERDMVTLTDAERLSLFDEFVYDVSTYEYLMRVAPTPETARDMADLLLFTHNLMENTARRTQNFVNNSADSSMTAVYQQWLRMREQLQKAWNTPGIDPKTVEDLEKSAEKLEKKLSGYGVPIALQEKDVTWTDVRDALMQGEVAVALHHLVRVDWLTYEQSDAFVACILRPGGQEPEFVFLDNPEELQVFGVQQFQREIAAKTPLSPSLYEKFWSVIAQKTADAHTVFYAPDGFFHHINPNALRLSDGHFLIDSVEIRQISNLRELPQLRKTEPARTSSAQRRAVFLGNPKFDLFAARTPEPMAGNTLRDLAEEMETQGFLLRALPGSEVEVSRAGAMLAARGWSVEMLVGAAATEDSLKKITSPDILHIATHGFYQKNEKIEVEHPGLRTMLFLAGSQNTLDGTNPENLPNDGILTAYEASVLPLGGTDLVVLSACKSGQGKIIEGEGVFGLQRAFRIAGAKSLIMSLWEVEDAATAILMNTFYENWLSGMSKSEAFRKAQLALKAKYPQPFYWGSFILVNG